MTTLIAQGPVDVNVRGSDIVDELRDVADRITCYTNNPGDGLMLAAAAEIECERRRCAAYKWAYEYLQDRMESIGRSGWAHDCDGEIEARIATPNAKSQATAAALSRQVACTDGLGVAVPPAPTFGETT